MKRKGMLSILRMIILGGKVMDWFRENKWKIGCIGLAIAVLILSVNSVALSKQNDKHKREIAGSMYTEWYRLFLLTQMVDKHYIKHNFQDPIRYQLLVNHITHYFTGRPDELTSYMRNLLVLAYDPLFLDLSSDQGPLNKEEAYKLLKAMNDDIMTFSRGFIDMNDDEKEKLLDPDSAESIKLSTQVKEVSHKYIKLVDDYYKNNKK